MTKQVLILQQAQIKALLPLDIEAINCIEHAFQTLATKPVIMPPVLRMDFAETNGEVDIKTAYIPGVDSFAIKVSPGFFNNPQIGLPSLNGLMILLSTKTGMLESILLDQGYLTAIRTAAAGAVACKHLARTDAHKVAVIGAGEQAALQLQANTLVRDIQSAKVWAPKYDKAQAFATKQSTNLNIPITASASIEQAVIDADIIITATPSTTPLVQLAHLRPGIHITAMGADAEHKNEIEPQILTKADLYTCDRQSQTSQMGELHHAIKHGFIDSQQTMTEIGQIIAGQSSGRRSNNEITICDLTGTGIQDTAIANMAYQKALHGGFGSFI